MSHSFLRGLGVQRGDDFFYVYSTEKLHTIKFLIVFTLVRLARLVGTQAQGQNKKYFLVRLYPC